MFRPFNPFHMPLTLEDIRQPLFQPAELPFHSLALATISASTENEYRAGNSIIRVSANASYIPEPTNSKQGSWYVWLLYTRTGIDGTEITRTMGELYRFVPPAPQSSQPRTLLARLNQTRRIL